MGNGVLCVGWMAPLGEVGSCDWAAPPARSSSHL